METTFLLFATYIEAGAIFRLTSCLVDSLINQVEVLLSATGSAKGFHELSFIIWDALF